MNKSYINENTGLLIADRFLEDGLLYMKDNWRKYRPKKWALANISPEKTTEKLLEILEARNGSNDSNEVYYKTNNPEVSYFDYPDIEFSDLNKKVLKIFEADSSQGLDKFYKEKNTILDCHQTFLSRISGGGAVGFDH